MKNRKKILFISDAGDKRGAQKSLMELILTLQRNYNVYPILITKKNNELNRICNKYGIENYSFWYRYVMSSSPYSMWWINFIKHCLGRFAYLIGYFMQIRVNKLGINFDDIDIIHTNTNRVDLGLYLNRKYKIPHIMHLREFGVEDFGSVIYRRNMYKAFNCYTDKFIAISNCVRQGWIQKGLSESKINVIYNGLDTSKYHISEKKVMDTLEIVIAGAINKFKGQMQIIEAVHLLPENLRNCVRVTFLGEGKFDYIYAMKKKMQEYEVTENFVFAGYTRKLEDKLSEYDIGLITSKAEGFGRVTVEYMLSGLCVVASDTGANPELIINGKSGYLYPYGNAEKLSEILADLVKHKEKIYSMGKAGNQRALELYTTEINADNIYHLYQELLQVDIERGKYD